MLYWNPCWTLNAFCRKMSGSGFKVFAVFSCLNLFLLTIWQLLHWLTSVITLLFSIFHFLIRVCFLIRTPCMARVVPWCSGWTQAGRSSRTWQPCWRPLNCFPKISCICMIQQQHPWAAAALRSELLCYHAALYWGHLQSSSVSSSWSSSSYTWGPLYFNPCRQWYLCHFVVIRYHLENLWEQNNVCQLDIWLNEVVRLSG